MPTGARDDLQRRRSDPRRRGIDGIGRQASGRAPPRCGFRDPGVTHAIYNTVLTDLTFIVVTAPPEDAKESSR
jgi:hypothetical protein